MKILNNIISFESFENIIVHIQEAMHTGKRVGFRETQNGKIEAYAYSKWKFWTTWGTNQKDLKQKFINILESNLLNRNYLDVVTKKRVILLLRDSNLFNNEKLHSLEEAVINANSLSITNTNPPKKEDLDQEKLVSSEEKALTQTPHKELSTTSTEKLKSEINILAQESIPPALDFQQNTQEILEKYGMELHSNQTWRFFHKGKKQPYLGAEKQWKLFLNPKPSEFHSTLDRALKALESLPDIDGKIVYNDKVKRRSDLTVINDPTEPKFLFYFNGPESEKIFKKAVALLEQEFIDADVVGAAAGKRTRPDGSSVEQWGPSFTKSRNRLMFYTQGGYAESGRDRAIINGNLAEEFEGENYYLHKGGEDPLQNLPSPIYIMTENKVTESLENLDSKVENKNQLIHFYLNQAARLQDLKNQLAKANPKDQHKIRLAILKIENASIQKIITTLKIQLNTENVSLDQIADYLGKSVVSTRGIILGQNYQHVILKKLPQIVTKILSINHKKFEGYLAEVIKLNNLQKSGELNLANIAYQWGMTNQDAMDTIMNLVAMAQELDKTAFQDLKSEIESEVAANLKISPKDIDQWIQALDTEKRLNTELTRLGREKPSFQESSESMNRFLNEMKANQNLFNQPLQLIKLQNILNQLNQTANPTNEMQKWKQELQGLIEQVAINMTLHRQETMTQLLNNWDAISDIHNAVAKNFYKDLQKAVEGLDVKNGTIQGKIEYINKQAEQTIATLEKHISNLKNSPNITKEQFKSIYDSTPPSFQPILMRIATKELKTQLIKQIRDTIVDKAKEKSIKIPNEELNLIEEHLKDTFVTFIDGDLSLKKKGWGTYESPYDTLNNILSLNYFGSSIDALKQELEKENPIKISGLPNKADVEKGMKLAITKLKNIQIRQKERLELTKKGENVVIPQYFHATSEKPATSIAKTGIEAVVASSGFGSFISTIPEFRYGYVSFGLPKTVEFTSQAHTVYSKTNSAVITEQTQLWAGLKELISINPRIMRLQQNFSSAIESTLQRSMDSIKDLPAEKRLELQVRLLQFFNRSVVFRANSNPEGWSLNYRDLNPDNKPIGNNQPINTIQDLTTWTEKLIKKCFKNTGIPETQQELIKKTLLQDFEKHFKQTYYYGQKSMREDFLIEGHPKEEKLKACIIAPDDDEEAKQFYKQEYARKAKSDKIREFKTLSEVKETFAKEKLTDLVDFIPLSEQLIERDFLLKVGLEVPKAWS